MYIYMYCIMVIQLKVVLAGVMGLEKNSKETRWLLVRGYDTLGYNLFS